MPPSPPSPLPLLPFFFTQELALTYLVTGAVDDAQMLYEQVYALLRRQEGADVDCARTLCNLGVRLRGLVVSIVLWMRAERERLSDDRRW